MKRKIFIFCLVFLFSVATFFLFSEVLVLKNGDVIRGKLIKMDEDTMTIVSEKGEFIIDRDEINYIYEGEEFYKSKYSTLKKNIVEKETETANGNEMIFVKGGTFIMGDIFGGGRGDEIPVHNVTVADFYISKYEITFEEFDKYCDGLGIKKKSEDKDFNDLKYGPKDFKRPVWKISWYEAIEYCNWLSQIEGLTPCYSIDKKNKDQNNKNPRDKLKWNVECNFKVNGYRLPTEAEWEYAARGGNKSRGYKYAGSNNLNDCAVNSIVAGWKIGGKHISILESNAVTYCVGSKKSNELGLFDMSGNVWEWCWDWYNKEYYRDSSMKNPQGSTSGKSRVLRGGSWNNQAFLLRVSNRKEAVQNDDYDWRIGFRVVRNAK